MIGKLIGLGNRFSAINKFYKLKTNGKDRLNSNYLEFYLWLNTIL